MPSSHHPQSDGQTERVNRTLEQMLCTYIQSGERESESLLPALELASNMTSHSFTEFSSFDAVIGKNPLTAANLDVVGGLAPMLTPRMTKVFPAALRRSTESHLDGKMAAEVLRGHKALSRGVCNGRQGLCQ